MQAIPTATAKLSAPATNPRWIGVLPIKSGTTNQATKAMTEKTSIAMALSNAVGIGNAAATMAAKHDRAALCSTS
jgi:hypothetical protein